MDVFRRSEIVANVWPSATRVDTLSIPMSRTSLVYRKLRQNQERSSPVEFSMLRKKSPGVGCLNAQVLVYSRKPVSNSSGPMT